MNEMMHNAAEIDEEEALWKDVCITCEPTGAGCLAGDESAASIRPQSIGFEWVATVCRN